MAAESPLVGTSRCEAHGISRPKSGSRVTAAKSPSFSPAPPGVSDLPRPGLLLSQERRDGYDLPLLCLGAERRQWSATFWIPHRVRDDGGCVLPAVLFVFPAKERVSSHGCDVPRLCPEADRR
jgi:hypothetical protein